MFFPNVSHSVSYRRAEAIYTTEGVCIFHEESLSVDMGGVLDMKVHLNYEFFFNNYADSSIVSVLFSSDVLFGPTFF